MRLDDSDNLNVEDQRSGDFSAVGFGGSRGGLGLIGMLIAFVASRFGCGGLIVLMPAYMLFSVVGNIKALLAPTAIEKGRLSKAAV